MNRSVFVLSPCLLALAAAGCAPQPIAWSTPSDLPDWSASVSTPAPAPPIELSLDISAMAAGLPATIVISDAIPGEGVHLVRSTAGLGAGPCPGVIGGGCLDIQAPVTPMGPYTANAGGVATLAPTLPGGLVPGTEVCLQAVAVRGPGGVDSVKSPTVCRIIDGGPTGILAGSNLDDQFDDSVITGGFAMLAYKIDIPVAMDVGYLQVFTGEGVGTQEVMLWTHDAVNDEPDRVYGMATWEMAGDNQWQGAALVPSVSLFPGTTVWLSWFSDASAVQAPRAETGTPVTYRGSLDGGITWDGPFTNFEKARLCAPGGC